MFSDRFRCHKKLIVSVVCCFAMPVASGQSGETDVGEVAVLGGGTFGIGARPAVMGSTGLTLSRYGMALFNSSFLSLGQHTIQPWPAPSSVDRSLLFDFGLDFHIRIPVKKRLAPYGIVGSGLLWNMVRQHTVNINGIPVVYHYDQLNGALHTGAGVRYYAGESWGIRSEVRVIVSKQTYTQVMVGVFYVTPTSWP